MKNISNPKPMKVNIVNTILSKELVKSIIFNTIGYIIIVISIIPNINEYNNNK